MAISRVPGILDLEQLTGCVYRPHSPPPDPNFEFSPWMHPGTLDWATAQLLTLPPPTDDGKEDAEELRLLQKVYGVRSSNKSRSYRKTDKKTKKQVDDVENYVTDRTEFFGADFKTYKATALEELTAGKGWLRRIIEPPPEVRNSNKDIWEDAQTVFYCWVREGIIQLTNALDRADGTKMTVPEFLKLGQSEALTTALGKVRSDYKTVFRAGGFNPRPMKEGGLYILGTISEHALGKAIDIEDSKNAQIKADQWKFVLAFAGKSLDAATRKSKWKSNPKSLFESIKEVNDAFVKKLAETAEKAEKAALEAAAKEAAAKEAAAKEAAAKAAAAAKEKPTATAAATPTPAATTPTPLKVTTPSSVVAKKITKDRLDLAIDSDTNLKSLGKPFLTNWQNGFFSLEWTLVKSLSDHGFTWGATFPSPDLHHFEL